MVKDEEKLKVIWLINHLLANKFVNRSLYRIELKAMRNRYIYKDISIWEFNKDVEYLTNVKNLDWFF